jgi:hypothetical protein
MDKNMGIKNQIGHWHLTVLGSDGIVLPTQSDVTRGV